MKVILRKYIRTLQHAVDVVIERKLELDSESSQPPEPADVDGPIVQSTAQPREVDSTAVKHCHRVPLRPCYLQDFVTFVYGAE